MSIDLSRKGLWRRRLWGKPFFPAFRIKDHYTKLASCSLQRFKLNIANSVVTQQNSGMESMDTDLVLDLFRRTSEEEDAAAAAKKKAREASGPVSQKNVLLGLEDLPAEEEYQGLDLSSFMGSLVK